jgi:spore coat protein U-like protein
VHTNTSPARTILLLVASGAASSLALPGGAVAGTQQTTLTVNATVTANCTITANPVAFGSVNPLTGTAFDAAGSLDVTCTTGSAWSATADAGAGASATLTARRMTSGAGNTLNYALYTNSGRTLVWGSGAGGTSALTGTGTGAVQSVPIYGRITAGQTTVPAATYGDTVTVTITY